MIGVVPTNGLSPFARTATIRFDACGVGRSLLRRGREGTPAGEEQRDEHGHRAYHADRRSSMRASGLPSESLNIAIQSS